MRNKDPPKRRRTPADDPSILESWREFETEHREHGYSYREIHQKLADQHNISSTTARNWLTYGRGFALRAKVSYEEKLERDSNYLPRNAFYKRFRRSPGKFIAPLFQSPDELLSVEDVAVRLEEEREYKPRLQALERRLTTPHPLTGVAVLEPAGDSGLYRLATGLFEKYRGR